MRGEGERNFKIEYIGGKTTLLGAELKRFDHSLPIYEFISEVGKPP